MTKKSDNSSKGRIVERIVAAMHERADLRVERNVSLPAIDGSGRTREIDVLLSGNVAGYPVRIAIECKNYKNPVGVKKIDEFIGELADVGIPPAYSIYVCTNGFTGGAVHRARNVGMKVFTLQGLTKDRLNSEVSQALQNIVFLVPRFVQATIANGITEEESDFAAVFFNESGHICGVLPDLIWRAWINGTLSAKVGEHEIELSIPRSWVQRGADGRLIQTGDIRATVHVDAAVVSFTGKEERHALVEASSKNVFRTRSMSSFDAAVGDELPVHIFSDESSLEKYLSRGSASVRLTVRGIKSPRIVSNSAFWPPSLRAWKRLKNLVDTGQVNGTDRLVQFQQLEGPALNTAWEPIHPGHPAADSPERWAFEDDIDASYGFQI